MATLKLGTMVALPHGPEQELEKVQSLGLATCQVSNWDPQYYTDDMAGRLLSACKQFSVEVTTIWAGTPGRTIWNFIDGPRTIGLVPDWTRNMRLDALKRGADFAKKVGAPSITTHVGFLPEDPNDPRYAGTLDALKDIAGYCGHLGLGFWFETGQETPITLLRTIQDIGTDNLGINLDPANLLLYGKANPVDALDVFGQYVRGVHAKDGEYPTDGRELGKEKALGEGRVDFPRLVPKLKSMGFQGALTIEREISGPKQIEDIKRAIALLTPLL
ncbi:MAG: sugar phosphate isomerase/epimerase family protein [Anaerolineae bacterium]